MDSTTRCGIPYIVTWGFGKMGQALGALFGFGMMIGAFAAWITHIYQCFTMEQWGFLIAGALFFPIAVVHGIGIWFGVC